jgi:hypothetical protein
MMAKLVIDVPDDLLREARQFATRSGTPLAEIVRRLIVTHVGRQKCRLGGNYEILLDYSLGKRERCSVMQELHLEYDEDLMWLMWEAGLPAPRLKRGETGAMRRKFEEILDICGTLPRKKPRC